MVSEILASRLSVVFFGSHLQKERNKQKPRVDHLMGYVSQNLKCLSVRSHMTEFSFQEVELRVEE